jgi:hypothetical protein
MAGPSQPQVTDEVWDDDRVKSFLHLVPLGAPAAEFNLLLKAYRGMRAADFERFLVFYMAAGHDLDATDSRARTIWDIIGQHRLGEAFLAARDRVVKTQ